MGPKAIVQVAVADTDLEAIIYQKLLKEKGIQSIILDHLDNPYVPSRNVGKKVECLKLMALETDELEARKVIKQFEEKKDTRIISKSGGHIIFRCHNCMKCVCFEYAQRGSKQFCAHCKIIVEVPG